MKLDEDLGILFGVLVLLLMSGCTATGCAYPTEQLAKERIFSTFDKTVTYRITNQNSVDTEMCKDFCGGNFTYGKITEASFVDSQNIDVICECWK